MTSAPETSLPAPAGPAVRRPVLRRPPPTRPRRAFTLIELLVVMGIIVLLLALALPAFRFITGSRSAEAAGNQLGAALSIARAQAIGIQETRGVAIYRDPNNDRSVAALVELKPAAIGVFTAGGTGVGVQPPPVPYVRGQYVLNTAGTLAYVCIESYSSTAATDAPGTPGGAAYWRGMPSLTPVLGTNASIVDLLPGAEFIVLPNGIDARGVANQIRFPNNATTSTDPTYRYMNPTVVLFDSNGQIVSQNFCIAREGLLGQPIEQVGGFIPGPANNTYPYGTSPLPAAGAPHIYTGSQVGLVLYDTEIFKNVVGSNGTSDAQADWLDQNATPLMINRFNGTLVKGD